MISVRRLYFKMLKLIGKFGKYTELKNETPAQCPKYAMNITDTFYQTLYKDVKSVLLKEHDYIEKMWQQGYNCVTVLDEYYIRDLLLKHYKFNINLERYLTLFVCKHPNILGYELFLLEYGTPKELYLAVKEP